MGVRERVYKLNWLGKATAAAGNVNFASSPDVGVYPALGSTPDVAALAQQVHRDATSLTIASGFRTYHATASGMQQDGFSGRQAAQVEQEDVGDDVVHCDRCCVHRGHVFREVEHVLGWDGHQFGPGAELREGHHLISDLEKYSFDCEDSNTERIFKIRTQTREILTFWSFFQYGDRPPYWISQ